jgi:predicted DNA-binding transcriptional regulator YafY
VPPSPRYSRHIGIVHQLRSRAWTSATALATRYGVSVRTIYRDIEQLIAAGLPIESVAGREGGYRLGTEGAITSLTVDADDALRLYVLGLIDADLDTTTPDSPGISTYSQATVRRLSQRIYFDTADWYWQDEGSGHVPAIRHALLTSTAIEITTRTKHSADNHTTVVKPYGLVWKGGEWWLVAVPLSGPTTRYRLNHIDRLAPTDLRFTHPDDFDLRTWWTQTLQDYGRGPNRVELLVHPPAREEMLRLGLKPDSEVHHEPDGTTRIVLHVDKWQWLIPMVASFGADVTVTEPDELRAQLAAHHARALSAYPEHHDTPTTDYRNDDSRLRTTRSRAPLPTRR